MHITAEELELPCVVSNIDAGTSPPTAKFHDYRRVIRSLQAQRNFQFPKGNGHRQSIAEGNRNQKIKTIPKKLLYYRAVPRSTEILPYKITIAVMSSIFAVGSHCNAATLFALDGVLNRLSLGFTMSSSSTLMPTCIRPHEPFSSICDRASGKAPICF